jgi:crossover junction endodeoxyribonuclease RusA
MNGKRARCVRFTLPLPPGVNQQYTRAGDRRVLSKKSRDFKKRAAHILRRLIFEGKLSDEFLQALREGYVGLFLDFYFETPLRRDLDGGLKIAQDVICDTLGVNDNRVVDVHLLKRIDPNRPRLEVELEAINDWQFDLSGYVLL